jgi:phage recombination protein Bet
MSREVATRPQNGQISNRPSALGVMASKYNIDPQRLLSILKNTIFKGASDDELGALVIVANQYGLNPMLKEIYGFPAKGGGIVPVVSVDGWARIINDHLQMDGLEFEHNHDAKGDLESCTCIIWRKDRNRPIKVTEYLSECRRTTEPWKMTHRMLRHKALIQCARVAFGFSGIYDEDEAARFAAIPATSEHVELMDKPIKPSFQKQAETVVEEIVEEAEKVEPAEAEQEKEPEPEGFVLNDEPEPFNWQRELYAKLSNAGIVERTFIGWLKKSGQKAETVMSLPDEVAEQCVLDWEEIVGKIK